jgi:pyrroloquinoline quinone biosynthesis protein E
MLPNPLALIAELTHRCPLHCVYCSNPLKMAARSSELATSDWVRVFSEAHDIGVLHVHLTGGEPLSRPDLVELVSAGREFGLYSNLITSGIGLSERRLAELVTAGLDHIQLSFQDSRADRADWIAGVRSHSHKIAMAKVIRTHRLAFTVNMVVHRQNLDHLEEMIAFAEGLECDRIEIAHAQYYGWALRNRALLMPTRTQVNKASEVIAAAKQRLAGRTRIDSIVADYYARYPKACMGGWGQRSLLVDPAGRALPCHAADVIPGLVFDNVRDHSLRWLWEESEAFQRFRGQDWMPEPCRSCERKNEDFGGCRCQAFILAGDASATDPVCSKSSLHSIVNALLVEENDQPGGASMWATAAHPLQRTNTTSWVYRNGPA